MSAGMGLSALQQAYRDYLLEGRSDSLAEVIVADAFDAEERLRIYRNNFLIGLGEALKANFPVTMRLLGEDFFAQAARAFVLQAPPARPCLFEYGEGFAEFLETLSDLAALPYVAEMARFEFARIGAFHAPVETLLGEAEIARVPPEALADLPMRLAAHVHLLELRYPVEVLWQAHQAAEPDLAALDMAPRPHALLVCRPQRALVAQEIGPDSLAFLAAARQPTTLAQAAEACGSEMDPERLGRVIGLALQHGLLVSG